MGRREHAGAASGGGDNLAVGWVLSALDRDEEAAFARTCLAARSARRPMRESMSTVGKPAYDVRPGTPAPGQARQRAEWDASSVFLDGLTIGACVGAGQPTPSPVVPFAALWHGVRASWYAGAAARRSTVDLYCATCGSLGFVSGTRSG